MMAFCAVIAGFGHSTERLPRRSQLITRYLILELYWEHGAAISVGIGAHAITGSQWATLS